MASYKTVNIIYMEEEAVARMTGVCVGWLNHSHGQSLIDWIYWVCRHLVVKCGYFCLWRGGEGGGNIIKPTIPFAPDTAPGGGLCVRTEDVWSVVFLVCLWAADGGWSGRTQWQVEAADAAAAAGTTVTAATGRVALTFLSVANDKTLVPGWSTEVTQPLVKSHHGFQEYNQRLKALFFLHCLSEKSIL